MRERHILQDWEGFGEGITPAHAGKTNCRGSYHGRREDHPRACGKDPSPAKIQGFPLGSPPRMRERHGFFAPTQPFLGITPAHAGKTTLRWCSNRW